MKKMNLELDRTSVCNIKIAINSVILELLREIENCEGKEDETSKEREKADKIAIKYWEELQREIKAQLKEFDEQEK